MIRLLDRGHGPSVPGAGLEFEASLETADSCSGANDSAADRLRNLVQVHHAFVWRALRRLGVPHGDVDDGVQKVFLIASRKLGNIKRGCERSFLYQTALRVASDRRRTERRRREVDVSHAAVVEDPGPRPDELVELRRMRERLDVVLEGMPLDLRAVFVLFELDQSTLTEISELLGIPRGTAASRLRRARLHFYAHLPEAKPDPNPMESRR